MKHKNGFLLFLSSCIPGCGQMHQGYMKRGLSLMAAFCAVLCVALFLSLGELCLFLPLVWLYAFFDSYNLHGQSEEVAVSNPDAFLFGLSDMDSERMTELCRKRHSLIGWVLVALGGYALYTTVVGRLVHFAADYFDAWWLSELLVYTMPRMIATLLLIALGMWFIRGPKAKAPEEDFPSFTPPAGETEEPHGDE